MDESAIRLLQQTAIAANDNRQARMPEATIALPENFTIHDLEQFQDHRRRYRGKLETASLSDFVGYVKRERPFDGAAGFIDADNLSAQVIFDLGNEAEPGHAVHRATLKLKSTAAYRAVVGVNGKRMDQRDLIEWMQDWGRNITGIVNDDGNPVTPAQAIEAIRKIQISSKKDSTHTQEERRAQRSAMEEVEAKASPALPDRITFQCEPYFGLPARDFVLRLGVITSHDEPELVLRIVGLEEQQEDIAQDFKAELIDEIGDAATLTIGTFAT